MSGYKVIGVMSGTSLDGIDIAFCNFSEKNNKWNYKIIKAKTISYNDEWRKKLNTIEKENAFNFIQVHVEYGNYIGQLVKEFIEKDKLKVDFISSHGHTIFHQPDKKVTFQIGEGSAIAAVCNIPVVCNFRALDIALGGQGAPLVPIGDKLLFSNYHYCLNLGGFANISFEKNKERIAFDICPVNIVTNELCQSIGKNFDNKGKIGKKGIINAFLLNELNALQFYSISNGPKSLSKEWVLEKFYPIINKYTVSLQDKLRTLYEHMALQITEATKNKTSTTILITGGGAYNTFLIERISALTNHKIIIPDQKTIEFKEALIFAFLGVLRIRKQINCLKSVTGATKDNVGGCVTYIN